ncbi:hypothetical protein J6590_045701 [Homalodisca vitripennis]|nr:hypothetical protein J6590_045701 [Homalodisca vitripennis]
MTGACPSVIPPCFVARCRDNRLSGQCTPRHPQPGEVVAYNRYGGGKQWRASAHHMPPLCAERLKLLVTKPDLLGKQHLASVTSYSRHRHVPTNPCVQQSNLVESDSTRRHVCAPRDTAILHSRSETVYLIKFGYGYLLRQVYRVHKITDQFWNSPLLILSHCYHSYGNSGPKSHGILVAGIFNSDPKLIVLSPLYRRPVVEFARKRALCVN